MSSLPVRIRERFDAIPSVAYYYVDGHLEALLNCIKWRHYSHIRDQINPKMKNGRRSMGFCQHLKVDKTVEMPSFSYRASDGRTVTIINYTDIDYSDENGVGNGQSPAGSSSLSRPDDVGYSNMVGSFLYSPTHANLCAKALSKQLTQVPAKISLINFVVELKDFKDIIHAFSKIPKKLQAAQLAKSRALLGLKFSVNKKLPKKIAKAGIDSFLSWNFQWAPFIGDLQTLTTVGDSAYKRLDYLIKTNNKVVPVRFIAEDCYTHPSLGQTVHSKTFGSSAHRYVLRAYTCDFHSTWQLFHNLKELQDSLSGLRAVFATLGLNNPIKAAWNAIPFSFLVDWVGPIGDWLERAAVQPYTGDWVISDCSSSIRETYIIDFFVDNYPDSKTTLVESVRVDNYVRLPGLPVTLGAVDFSQLTDTQQKLFLSIPLSKLLK